MFIALLGYVPVFFLVKCSIRSGTMSKDTCAVARKARSLQHYDRTKNAEPQTHRSRRSSAAGSTADAGAVFERLYEQAKYAQDKQEERRRQRLVPPLLFPCML